MFIIPSTIACCLVLDGWLDLWLSFCLAKEVFLLGQRLLLIVTRLLPWPINLYVFASIYLSSGYLTSSSTAHGPILISGLFIPTRVVFMKYDCVTCYNWSHGFFQEWFYHLTSYFHFLLAVLIAFPFSYYIKISLQWKDWFVHSRSTISVIIYQFHFFFNLCFFNFFFFFILFLLLSVI